MASFSYYSAVPKPVKIGSKLKATSDCEFDESGEGFLECKQTDVIEVKTLIKNKSAFVYASNLSTQMEGLVPIRNVRHLLEDEKYQEINSSEGNVK